MSDVISLQAPAKINLTLEILGRRTDGYHNLSSVVQAVGLYDTLSFQALPGSEIVVECDEPALAAPQSNLVWRATRLIQQVRSVPLGARITLEKNIPLAAGLGGGSSDAAATLLGLNELWNLGLQMGELQNLAGVLGSDVAFFLHGGTALISGRGEQVIPLRPLAGGLFVLVTPPLELPDKTATVYLMLRSYEYTKGVLTEQLVATLALGQMPPPTLLYNGLEDAVFRAFEPLDAIRQQIGAAGGEFVRVTGAGPSLYVYYADEAPARTLYAALKNEGLPVHLLSPV
jgi:4-diphosphocytidyl-2-C-methyl-D-erythritol kinase